MKILKSKRERVLETENQLKQFTIDSQDFRLSAQRILLKNKELYIKETEAMIEEQQAEIDSLIEKLNNQRSINSQLDIQLSVMKEKGGDFGLN